MEVVSVPSFVACMRVLRHARLTLITVAVTTALLALSSAAPAGAAYPGTNGLVAFVTGRSGFAQIWTVDPATSVETHISDGTAADTAPAWSPFGNRIAFGRSGDVWTMHADGTHLVDLTATDPYNDGTPSWSPDGKKIAFESDRDTTGRSQIFVMNQNGTNAVRLTIDTGTDTTPRWSPDGSHILFVSNMSGNREIYSISPTGANPTNLTQNTAQDYSENWSPDGAHIVFTSGRAHPGSVGADLWIMNADGSGQTAFVHENNGYSDGDYPAYSPDGTEIVFSANNGGGSQQLWTAPAGGGLNTRLTNDTGQPANTQADWQPIVPAPKLTLHPKSGAPSTSVNVSATGFGPKEKVKLQFHDANGVTTALGTAVTDASGAFATAVTVPAGAATGRGSIKASGVVSELSARHVFTVTAP
jgi:TolB protein